MRADGARLYLLAEGRLVNISAAEGHPAIVMDMSFANQALSTEYAVQHAASLERRVYPVPREIDEEIARLKLATMGVTIDTLTEEQATLPRLVGRRHLSRAACSRTRAARSRATAPARRLRRGGVRLRRPPRSRGRLVAGRRREGAPARGRLRDAAAAADRRSPSRCCRSAAARWSTGSSTGSPPAGEIDGVELVTNALYAPAFAALGREPRRRRPRRRHELQRDTARRDRRHPLRARAGRPRAARGCS